MQNPSGRDARLSRDVVVRAAIALLDERGEAGFTLRVLIAHLRTGAGAVYWHVANRAELVDLAADLVLADALAVADSAPDAAPLARARALGLAVFDALDAHPWAGAHVSSALPTGLAVLERLGRAVTDAGVPDGRRFDAATVLFDHVVAAGAQVARNATRAAPGASRSDHLTEVADRWRSLDPHAYPFLRAQADHLASHDDRDQFAAGLDLILAGIGAAASA